VLADSRLAHDALVEPAVVLLCDCLIELDRAEAVALFLREVCFENVAKQAGPNPRATEHRAAHSIEMTIPGVQGRALEGFEENRDADLREFRILGCEIQ